MVDENATASAVPAGRMVSIAEAIPLYIKNYINFKERSSRGAYWWAALILFIVGNIIGFVEGMIFGATMVLLSSLFSLATILPSIGLGVRRLHDIGRSGWWILIAFTIIGIPVLIYWYCQPGQRADNQFGPDHEAGR